MVQQLLEGQEHKVRVLCEAPHMAPRQQMRRRPWLQAAVGSPRVGPRSKPKTRDAQRPW
jgi:hypothetical protein